MTPSWPLNRGLPIASYLDLPTPICPFIIQYSWGQWWRLRVVYMVVSPLLRTFWAEFWFKFGWVTWPVNRGRRRPHIWNPETQSVYSLCNYYAAMMKLSVVYWYPIVKQFLIQNFLSPLFGPYFHIFGKRVLMLIVIILTPKVWAFLDLAYIGILCVEMRSGVWPVG